MRRSYFSDSIDSQIFGVIASVRNRRKRQEAKGKGCKLSIAVILRIVDGKLYL